MRTLVLSLALAFVPALVAAQAASDLPPQQVRDAPGSAAWTPSEAQARRLVRQTEDYLSAKAQGRFADAYAVFAPAQKQAVPFDRWHADIERFNAKAGPFEGRSLTKLTWYRNPPGEQPGVYVAAEFRDQFRDLSLHCGYVAWRQRMDGSFEVVHEEENTIEKSVAARMSPEQLQRARAAFKC